ncbi:hypothetical protein Bca52824_024245 [Brassica carinata]|uniref:Uncharacterized protein n=1 Tax=Brassica carinata TaxID=52824 RepID=A0A8X7VK91_BRACI|nr:hypothetical protein Bca52824_024245 [Brassica carinata]
MSLLDSSTTRSFPSGVDSTVDNDQGTSSLVKASGGDLGSKHYNGKVKIYGARVRVDSLTKVAENEGAEKEKMKNKVKKILAHGINCFVNRQLIYNFPEELLADAGVLAIKHADFEG